MNSQAKPLQELLTLAKACSKLNRNPGEVKAAVAAGRLEAVGVMGGEPVFRAADVDRVASRLMSNPVL